MKKIASFLLVWVTATFSMEMGGYVNQELEAISFTDSLILKSVSIDKQLVPGSQGPVDESDTGLVSFNYLYSYDSINNEIVLSGKGAKQVFSLDDQKRVTQINEGSIRTTYITYGDKEMTIQVFPNDTFLTTHTFQWKYLFNDDGTTNKAIFTPTDWEYNGPIEWAPLYSDTISYSYDSNGKRIGAKRIFWDTNLFHSVPWKRSTDSVTYAYDSAYTGTDSVMGRMTVTMLSEFGTGWEPLKGDTQWVYLYNDLGQIVQNTERRWDGALGEWDQLYYFVSDYTYEDSLLVRKNKWLIYGDGTDSLLNRAEIYGYGINTIKYGVPNVANENVNKLNSANVNIIQRGNLLSVSRSLKFDKLELFSLSGRLLKSTVNTGFISLEGLNKNQQLFLVGSSNKKSMFVRKIIVK